MNLKPIVSVALLMCCALPVFASAKNTAKISLYEPLEVATTKLRPGEYEVVWKGTGPAVEVNFLEHNKVLATAPATLEANTSPYREGYETTTEPDNSKVLELIYSNKTKLAFAQGTNAKGK